VNKLNEITFFQKLTFFSKTNCFKVLGGFFEVKMSRISRSTIFLAVVVVLFLLVWQKIRIVFFVNLTLWQGLLLFGGGALVIFLVVDHFLNKTRD